MNQKKISIITPQIIIPQTITHNLSLGKPYHVQYNNRWRPAAACGATSPANAMVSAEIVFEWDKAKDPQMEDCIMRELMSLNMRKLLQKEHPGASYNPWNSSEYIVKAVNKLAGRTVCELQENNLQGIIYNLAVKKNPIVLGGAFTRKRHFVCVVGFITKQSNILTVNSQTEIDLDEVNAMIIDDSWGNRMKNYRDKNGNDNVMPLEMFKDLGMDGKKIKTTQVYKYRA